MPISCPVRSLRKLEEHRGAEHRGAEHRGGRITRQADDKHLAEKHAHLRKVCPMHARRMYARRPLRKWLQALRERRRGGT